MKKRVSTYAELEHWVNAFNSSVLDIMIVEGSAGAGKSSIIRNSLAQKGPEEYSWIEGRISAICLYEKLYASRDVPIFIDDVDGLYRDRECVNILKCLCQTWDEKTVTWNTKGLINKQGRASAPPEFKTRSKVCIITNSWKSLNKHVGAVEDRGLLIMFHPPAEEIHRYVRDELGNNAKVFDSDVYDFIGKNLGIIAEPSIRHYRNAVQLKQHDCDWRDVLIESFGLNDNQMLYLKIAKIPDLSQNDRAKEFARLGKKSERTYWRIRDDLRERGIDID